MPAKNTSTKHDAKIAGILDATLKTVRGDKDNKSEQALQFRPAFRDIAGGSLAAAVLLSQIWHRYYHNNCKQFYKYISPSPGKQRYIPGDSWLEELNFSYKEFNIAIKKIGVRVRKGDNKTKAFENNIIIYWKDGDDMMWWTMNLINFANAIKEAYGEASAESQKICDNLNRHHQPVQEQGGC